MRLVFAGTPEFAARALAALIAAGHDIPLVLTQPDRPAGRGMKLKMSPVKELALAHGLAVAQPESLRSEEARRVIVDSAPEVMVVAAYGLILPQAALDIPLLGCINIHASLLPRWRGAAPIQRAIEAGDAETGITLMQMDKGLDTGAMLSRHPLAIAPDDTAGSLHDKLAALGASAIVGLLPRLAEIRAASQDDNLATYAAKIGKEEARIDWTLPATALDRRIRAFNPFPGAVTHFQDEPLKIWVSRPAAGSGQPGEILSTSPLCVACGDGALELLEVQKAGGKRLAAAAYVAGNALAVGQRMT
ncbi:MAG TPA: methionyl-tRNA formyltransferase [Parasulfuritortus sp.]